MKRRLSWFLVPSLVFLFAVSPLPSQEGVSIVRINGAEYVPLDEMIDRFRIEHAFDMVARKGRLYRGGHQAVYGVGMSVMVVDGGLYRSSYGVRRSRGRVFLPREAGERVIESFFPGLTLEARGGRLVAEKRGKGPKDDHGRTGDRPVPGDRITFIVIDPGHGGKDPGAVGRGGLYEKTITLKVSHILEKKLAATLPGVRVVMTRKDDRFIELSRRTEIANRLLKKGNNGIFLSIHVNASITSKVSGFETFFLSQNPSNEDARSTAALENNVIILENRKGRGTSYDDVDYIEAMMITTQIQKESAALADSIQRGMAKKNRVFASRGVKKADFFVLRGVLMPASLVEIGYISNTREAKHLTMKAHQEAIAEGIANGVKSFVSRYHRLIKLN
ncbi:MAG: N-acetylmuramoyl-L-alanine amidase [Spirochaetes bacterium]|nr:N-acetylmuramoyl-L-alanine amidase [Spirochaetota bacterium]